MNFEEMLLFTVIALNVLLFGYIWFLNYRRKKEQKLWEDEVYELYDKVRKKLEQMEQVHMKKVSEEVNRVDENMQRRHNYLKKSYNDIADRLDIIEKMEKNVKDLYYQYEKSNAKLSELIALMPKSVKVDEKDQEVSETTVPILDEEVMEVVKLHQQGLTPDEIARQLGKAIPEVQLMLQIFSNSNNDSH